MRKFLLTFFIIVINFSVSAAENALISDIKIEGLQRVDPGLVFNNIPFEINDPIDEVNVSATIKLLYKTGQFKDISIEQEGDKIMVSNGVQTTVMHVSRLLKQVGTIVNIDADNGTVFACGDIKITLEDYFTLSNCSSEYANGVYVVAQVSAPRDSCINITFRHSGAVKNSISFSTAIDLYGNTGGSVASNTYTVPMRNSDGMYLDSSDNELYVIVRYAGDPTPIDDITLTFS